MKPEIRKLNSEELLSQTEALAREERRITLELIEHLREVDRRMLYAELGYGSLFEFAVKRLGLGEGAAQRRIAAMRLVRDVPEAKARIENGSITLSNAAKLQRAFQAEKRETRKAVPPAMKLTLLDEIAGLSQRECEAKILETFPNQQDLLRERERMITPEKMEVRFIMPVELKQKLDFLRELTSHKLHQPSMAHLIEYLADQELARLMKKRGIDPEIEVPPESTETHETQETTERRDMSKAADPKSSLRTQNEKLRSSIRRPIAIPICDRKLIWKRAQARCEYPGCHSRYRLEIDHIVPRARGGTNDIRNLRLLCRTHNFSEAMRILGETKMQHYRMR